MDRRYRLKRGAVSAADAAVNAFLAVLVLLLLFIGGYSLFDSGRLLREADPSRYAAYRPTGAASEGFFELAAQNPDVIGWITIYGTNIDYPLVQGEDNFLYENTDPLGEYCMSGSLFLDCRNARDFSDFKNIIYGHYMAGGMMFGGLSDYANEAYLNAHEDGCLFCNGRWYGIKVFAFLTADAYDASFYETDSGTAAQREAFLSDIRDSAAIWRGADVTADDHLLILSTCVTYFTSERYILAAVLTEDVPENSYGERTVSAAWRDQGILSGYLRHAPIGLWAAFGLLLLVALVTGALALHRRKKGKEKS